ncbi:MAG: hypothetical protein LUE27_01375 [Clostridia bacterium]|nr:hypothetical protein [Clostridia bacterium]
MKSSKLVFATCLKDEEMEDLRAFLGEITGLIEKHCRFTHDVEFIGLQDISCDGMKEADWTFLVMSSRPSRACVSFLAEQAGKYRSADQGFGDRLTSYAADRVIGKQFRARIKDYRSLQGFSSMEDLKLQLYYDICALTDLGGLSTASSCASGKVSIDGEELETVDACAAAVFAGNEEYLQAKAKADNLAGPYEELKAQHEDRKGDSGFLKEYREAFMNWLKADAECKARAGCVSDILCMTSQLRVLGALSDDYRAGYAHFIRGDFVSAYKALERWQGLVLHDLPYARFNEYTAARLYLEIKILPLLPKPLYINGRSLPVDPEREAEYLMNGMYRNVSGDPAIFPLTFFWLVQRSKDSSDKSFRDQVKKQLDSFKKAEGDTRLPRYRLCMMLANYYLDEYNGRYTKMYLDKALPLIQELSKEYGGIYDMYVGDTYVTYAVHYSRKHMYEEMQDSMFCATDRYKNCLAANPGNRDSCYRLASAYRSLAQNYAAAGEMQYARDYMGKAEDWFEKLYSMDKFTALENIAEMSEQFAEVVKPDEGVQDVGETEDCLLRALKAYKELAFLNPVDYIVHPGIMYDKLGCVFRRAGEYDEGMDYFRSAEAEYRTVIEVLGDIYNPLLAKCYVSMFAEPEARDLSEALEKLQWAADEFGKAAEQDAGFYTPEAAGAWRMLARAKMCGKDIEGAIEAHKRAIELFDKCDETDAESCYVSDLAAELSDVAELYDKLAEEDETKKDMAERYHLEAIGTAYCGEAVQLPDMGNTMQSVTSSYVFSLLHPGFNAFLALLYRYISNTTGDDSQALAEKAADFSDTSPDMEAEDDHVLSQMLEAMERTRKRARTDPDSILLLLGSYCAVSSQYGSMQNEKEAKKYDRKARKLFNEEFAPREEDWDYDPDEDETDIKDILGEELYTKLMEIIETLPQGRNEVPESFGEAAEEISDEPEDGETEDFAADAPDGWPDGGPDERPGRKTGKPRITDEELTDIFRGLLDGKDEEEREKERQKSNVEDFIKSLEEDPNPDDTDPGGLS